jgi:hypothetical protein
VPHPFGARQCRHEETGTKKRLFVVPKVLLMARTSYWKCTSDQEFAADAVATAPAGVLESVHLDVCAMLM